MLGVFNLALLTVGVSPALFLTKLPAGDLEWGQRPAQMAKQPPQSRPKESSSLLSLTWLSLPLQPSWKGGDGRSLSLTVAFK